MANETTLLPEEKQALSDQINTSTRSIHTQLNRLILARLPLALPPYSFCPSTYIFGLLHIAPIYITFESLWQRILETQCQPNVDNGTTRDAVDALPSKSYGFPSVQAKVSRRRYDILSNLQIQDLLRSERLRTDIRTFSRTSEQDVEEKLLEISQHGKVSEFLAHTTRSVNANPHALMAYAWVLYMALFAGGRHLRASLQNAGSDFWKRSHGVSPSQDPTAPDLVEGGNLESESHVPGRTQGLEFFHFPGEEDGEDIKRDFKMRFIEAEALLSDQEKDDIVCEAQQIFMFLVELVGELDQEQLLRRQHAQSEGQSAGVLGGPVLCTKTNSRTGKLTNLMLGACTDVSLGQSIVLSILAFLLWRFIGR